jgi:hypothetical protein
MFNRILGTEISKKDYEAGLDNLSKKAKEKRPEENKVRSSVSV